jgi:predicted CXXCH cytochrome family protein
MTGRKRRTLLLLAVALIWGGCSVEKHYDVLNFFFDGVPEPVSEETGAAGTVGGGRGTAGGGPVSSHSAYIARRCETCHGDRASFSFVTSGFSDVDDAVCMQCHQEVVDAELRLHGPVAVQACLFCHQPHVSPHPNLLVDASPGLCLRCHLPEVQGAPSSQAHEDLTRDCLECHFGHGGSDRYYLRPPVDSSTGAPAESGA